MWWFASLSATPFAADRATPDLTVLLRESGRTGFREEGSNPHLGIRRYWRKGRERFLSHAEIRSLGSCLRARIGEWLLAVAFVRLLLLTGCRKSEDPCVALDGLARRRAVHPGQQDWPPECLAVACRTGRAGRNRAVFGTNVSGPAGRRAALRKLVGSFLS